MMWTEDDRPLTWSTEDDWTKPCEVGVQSHQWRLVINDGARGLQSDCEACTDFINDMLAEAYVEADFPVTLTWESCDNPGGWHGTSRCDCDAYFIVSPREEV